MGCACSQITRRKPKDDTTGHSITTTRQSEFVKAGTSTDLKQVGRTNSTNGPKIMSKGLKNNSQIISSSSQRMGRKGNSHLKSALKNRKKNLQFTNYLKKLQTEKDKQILLYRVLLAQPQIKLNENFELVGLMIFDFFELRELIHLGQVSRVFYELAGRKEVLNKFFPSVAKKISKSSIVIETLDNEYGASVAKKPLQKANTLLGNLPSLQANQFGQTMGDGSEMRKESGTQNFYIYANEISIQFGNEQKTQNNSGNNVYFSQQPNKEKSNLPLETVESMTNFYTTHMVQDNQMLNSRRSNVSNKHSDFRETAKFGPGQLAALVLNSPSENAYFNGGGINSNYNSGTNFSGSHKLVTPKFNFGLSHNFYSTNQEGENVISSPTNGENDVLNDFNRQKASNQFLKRSFKASGGNLSSMHRSHIVEESDSETHQIPEIQESSDDGSGVTYPQKMEEEGQEENTHLHEINRMDSSNFHPSSSY